LAKPVPIRCNLQRPNVIVANPSATSGHKTPPPKKRTAAKSMAKAKSAPDRPQREKATAKAKAKAKAMAAAGKNSKVGKKKKEEAAAALRKVKAKGKAKAKAKAKSAAVKMTRKDVYSRAYHKAYQVCAKTMSKDVATAKSREKANAAVEDWLNSSKDS